MRMPAGLKGLDDRVLGRRRRGVDEPEVDGEVERSRERRPVRPRTGKGAREALGVVLRVSRLVFFALTLVLLVGIVFVLTPTNADNSVVRLVADVSDAVAGPFRDVFTVSDDRERELVVNYGFAAALYLVAALVLGKLTPSSS